MIVLNDLSPKSLKKLLTDVSENRQAFEQDRVIIEGQSNAKRVGSDSTVGFNQQGLFLLKRD